MKMTLSTHHRRIDRVLNDERSFAPDSCDLRGLINFVNDIMHPYGHTPARNTGMTHYFDRANIRLASSAGRETEFTIV